MCESTIQTVGVYVELDIDSYNQLTGAQRAELALNVSEALLKQSKSQLAPEGTFTEEIRVRVGETNTIVNPMYDNIKVGS